MQNMENTPTNFFYFLNLDRLMAENNIQFSDLDFSLYLKKGSLEAYKILFDQLYPKLFNYILKMSNNPEIAKDVVQNGFVNLWEKRASINTDLRIEYYLLKICRNEFLMYLRKVKKEKSLLDALKYEMMYELFLEEESNPTQLDVLEKVIQELPKRTKEAFLLSKYEHLKYKEIAQKMGISIKTVEKHISKAMKLIKGVLLLLIIYQSMVFFF